MSESREYTAERPLHLGSPDGIVRPARMIARAFGLRNGETIYVTGASVEDHVGRTIALLEGDVLFDETAEGDGGEGVTDTGAGSVTPDPGDPETVAPSPGGGGLVGSSSSPSDDPKGGENGTHGTASTGSPSRGTSRSRSGTSRARSADKDS